MAILVARLFQRHNMSETETTTEVNNHHESQDNPHLKIVDRVISEVPLVKTAVTVVEDGYDRVKGMNRLSATTLTLAEKSFSICAMTMKPIIVVFRRPISYADDLACGGLEKLEQAAPVIRRKPEDLLDDMKKYTTGKLQSAKDYGVNRFEPFVKTADTALNNAIDFANSWLPKADDKELPVDANSLVRFKALSSKLQFLISKRALNTLNTMKLSVSDSFLGKLTTSSIELGNKLVTDLVEKVRNQAVSLGENVKWLWAEVNREETEEEKQQLSLKRVGVRAVKRYVVVAKYVHGKLPESVQQHIQSGTNYADHLYEELKKAENVKDVYIVATTEIHAGVDATLGWISTHVPLANKLLAKSIKAE